MAVRTRSSRTVANGPELRMVTLDHPVLESVEVRVRRNRRGRHVRIHVDETGTVTASVPLRFAASRIDPIVRERSEWLHDVLAKMSQSSRNTEVDVEAGDPIRWLGGWVPTRLTRSGRRAVVELTDEALELRVPADADVHDALIAWYRREARDIFEQRVELWAQEIGLEYGKVSIRDQRTRWGSCTHKGDLSFNWRLVLAPLWVLDSIVVHELCHIEELNHSEDFWALVDARYPQHEEASEWLREHGPALRVTRRTSGPFGTARAWPRIDPSVAPSPAGFRPRKRRQASGSGSEQSQTSLF